MTDMISNEQSILQFQFKESVSTALFYEYIDAPFLISFQFINSRLTCSSHQIYADTIGERKSSSEYVHEALLCTYACCGRDIIIVKL